MTARVEEAEGRISEIEDKIMEKDEAEKKIKKILDHKGRIREISDLMKHNNIHIRGVPEEEERKRGRGLFEQITAKNFLMWGRKKASKSRKHRELPSE